MRGASDSCADETTTDVDRATRLRNRLLHRIVVLAIGMISFVPGAADADEAAPISPADELAAVRSELRSVIQEARSKVFPALVNIQLVTSIYSGGKEIRTRSVGSGTIVDDQGHVLTNQHVTNRGRRFRCTLFDRREVPAQLVGEDPLTDLAVLKLDLSALGESAGKLTVAKLGDSSQIETGDFVMAMGSPLALSRSVTLGIVSNTERVFAGGLVDADGDEMELSPGQRTGLFTRWIQHDALIQPGNSGGPLVNLRGEIIGVNELGGNQMGFAIPSNLARQVLDAIIAQGEVTRSWIGVAMRPIEKTGYERGVLVNSVVKGSPADRAGLTAGDVIIELDGEPVTVRFAEEIPVLLQRIADRPVGTELVARYLRDAKELETRIATAKLEKDLGQEEELRAWGMTAIEITPLAALQRRLASTEGVLVTGVRSGGSAASARPPLGSDDVVRAIDGKAVKNMAELLAIYEELAKRDPLPEQVLVEFERRGENYVTRLEPEEDEEQPEPPRSLAKAWLGVAVQPLLSDLAALVGLKEPGFRITRVYPATTAAEADLRVGDVITQLNGRKVAPRRAEDAGLFQRELRALDIGSKAELTMLRDGEIRTVPVVLETSRTTAEEARREHDGDFDLLVREVTFFDRVENRWEDDVRGVVVLSAEVAGWAGLAGVSSGDLIQKIDGIEVTDLATFRKALEQVVKEKPERVVFAVLRGVQTRFQFAEPEWGPLGDDDGAKLE